MFVRKIDTSSLGAWKLLHGNLAWCTLNAWNTKTIDSTLKSTMCVRFWKLTMSWRLKDRAKTEKNCSKNSVDILKLWRLQKTRKRKIPTNVRFCSMRRFMSADFPVASSVCALYSVYFCYISRHDSILNGSPRVHELLY